MNSVTSQRCVFLERTSVKFLSLILLLVCVSGAFGQSNFSFYVSKIVKSRCP